MAAIGLIVVARKREWLAWRIALYALATAVLVPGPYLYDDVAPFARRVVEATPERVVGGTDWPHPNMESHRPDDGLLVDRIPVIAPSEELRRKLLVDNPMRLYWGG